MELLTGRLSLRRPVPDDIGAIHAIHSDERACARNPGDLLASRAEAEQLYARWDEHWQRHAFGYWVVRHRGADERVRPANVASAHVALRAGLCRAEHLDSPGEDGLDHLYTSDPQAAARATASARESTTGTPAADRAALA